MADNERAAKVDFSNVSKVVQEYVKVVEKTNLERVEKLRRTRKNNIIIGSILGGIVLGIYAYSIVTVKQETFLDDFEEPQREPIAPVKK